MADDYYVATAHHIGFSDAHIHNASLIAAAPELLEALQRYMAYCKPSCVEGDEAYIIARAAIAKAKGEA